MASVYARESQLDVLRREDALRQLERARAMEAQRGEQATKAVMSMNQLEDQLAQREAKQAEQMGMAMGQTGQPMESLPPYDRGVSSERAKIGHMMGQAAKRKMEQKQAVQNMNMADRYMRFQESMAQREEDRESREEGRKQRLAFDKLVHRDRMNQAKKEFERKLRSGKEPYHLVLQMFKELDPILEGPERRRYQKMLDDYLKKQEGGATPPTTKPSQVPGQTTQAPTTAPKAKKYKLSQVKDFMTQNNLPAGTLTSKVMELMREAGL